MTSGSGRRPAPAPRPEAAGAAGGDAGLGGGRDARRAALNAARLRSLVTAHWPPGDEPREPHPFGAGAALTGTRDDGGRSAWILADELADRSLGPAMLWAERQGADRVHLLTPAADAAGVLARQAALFAEPVPEVLRVDGAALAPAEAVPVARAVEAPAPSGLVDLLIDAGLEVLAEGGVVRGEVNGLEVARIVAGVTTAGVPIDQPQLEVGVGKADRELTALVHGELSPVDQLGRVVAIVRQHRRAAAPPHPLNQLVPERWLRAVLCREPGLVGLVSLRPVEGARPRANLRDRDVAVALGEADGEPVVVVCSVGGALDLVPLAADARGAVDPGARLLLAVPERDDLPGNRRLAARLRDPAEVAPVPGDWRR